MARLRQRFRSLRSCDLSRHRPSPRGKSHDRFHQMTAANCKWNWCHWATIYWKCCWNDIPRKLHWYKITEDHSDLILAIEEHTVAVICVALTEGWLIIGSHSRTRSKEHYIVKLVTSITVQKGILKNNDGDYPAIFPFFFSFPELSKHCYVLKVAFIFDRCQV